METFKICPKFEGFHISCPMKFFVENWHTKNQGHIGKIVLIFYKGGFVPFPQTQLANRIVLLHKTGDSTAGPRCK